MVESHKLLKLAALFKEAISILGVDTEEHDFVDTPTRVAKVWREFCTLEDVNHHISKYFFVDENADALVVIGNLPFSSLCPHHFLPMMGIGHIAYLPRGGRLIGLSKAPRLLHAISRQIPRTQEAIASEVARILQSKLEPEGVMVVLQARHACMECRGALAHGSITTVSVVKGIFRNNPHAKVEAMNMMRLES